MPRTIKTFIDLTSAPPANDDLKRDVTDLRRDVATLAGILQNTNAMLAILALQLGKKPSTSETPEPVTLN